MTWFDGVLWGIAGVLALAAAWWTLPKRADLDWERLFKMAVVTRLRGPLEASGGTLEAWMELGRTRAWYHRSSRLLADKLRAPSLETLPVPALEGERGVVEQLIALDGPDARLQALFLDAGADEDLYADPGSLGDAWDLATLLGPEADWESVATWSEGLQGVLERRHAHLKWVVLGDLALHQALLTRLGSGRAVAQSAQVEDLQAELEAWVPELADRVVLVASGDALMPLLAALHASPGLRDRVLAVVSVAGRFGAEWIDEHFTHEAMDTEIARGTPYLSLNFLTHPGVSDVELDQLASGRFPSPEVPASGRAAIQAHDLGVLPGPLEAYPRDLLGDALLVAVTACLASG